MVEGKLRAIFSESADVCRGAGLEHLDPQAIEDFRHRWVEKSKNDTLATLSHEQLLRDAEVLLDDGLANAALILFGNRLAVRASKKLRNDELLVTTFAGTRLKLELDKIPLWRLPTAPASALQTDKGRDPAQAGGDHVPIKQLVEDFARYLYLPRLAEPSVLLGAVRDGVGLLTWEKDSFAYADSYDEAAGRYRGLHCGQQISVSAPDAPGLLVKSGMFRVLFSHSLSLWKQTWKQDETDRRPCVLVEGRPTCTCCRVRLSLEPK